jgi:hypothetical protein
MWSDSLKCKNNIVLFAYFVKSNKRLWLGVVIWINIWMTIVLI